MKSTGSLEFSHVAFENREPESESNRLEKTRYLRLRIFRKPRLPPPSNKTLPTVPVNLHLSLQFAQVPTASPHLTYSHPDSRGS